MKLRFKPHNTAKKTRLVTLWTMFLIVPLILGLASCNHKDSKSLTIYSGRSESLIGPLLNKWEASSNTKLNVRYGNSSDLALLINEEGDKTPADIIISQSPGALGFLANKGRLLKIPQNLSSQIRSEFRAVDNSWIGITGRQRVLVYNTKNVKPADLPNSIDDLTDPKYKGRVAVAPNNSSFQDFITAMRQERGDAATQKWLKQMADNGSPNYPKNSAIVTAVVAGEIDMGLVNHYYLLRELAENPDAPAINHFFDRDDIGALLIITAAAITKGSNNKSAAENLLNYLISPEAQRTFVEETKEYSLLPNIPSPEGVRDINAFSSPTLNNLYQQSQNLEDTLKIIEKSGIVER